MHVNAIHQRIEQVRDRLVELSGELHNADQDPGGKIQEVVVQLTTITDELIEQARRLETQRAHDDSANLAQLETEQMRLTAIIETAAEGMLVTDSEGQVRMANQAAERILNRPIKPGDSIEDIAAGDFLDLDLRPYRRRFPFVRSLLRAEPESEEELYLRISKDVLRRLVIRSRPLFDHHDRLIGTIGIILDVTGQHTAETELKIKEAEQEAQRLLLHQREVERAEIAREIHDGPIQHLTLIRFNIEQAMAMSSFNPSLEEIMKQIRAGVDSGVSELRDLCNHLRPPTLAPYGLEKAIRAHARSIRERFPAPLIILDLDPDDKRIPDESRTALFRIYQEALNNVIKHAKAGEVHVTLRMSADVVDLIIADDGVGFLLPGHWVEFARKQHFGVVGMIERAEAIGGTVDISSRIGRGTMVRVRAPLRSQKE